MATGTPATRERRLDRLAAVVATLPAPPDETLRLQIEALAALAREHPGPITERALGAAVTSGAGWLDVLTVAELFYLERLMAGARPELEICPPAADEDPGR